MSINYNHVVEKLMRSLSSAYITENLQKKTTGFKETKEENEEEKYSNFSPSK